jgi:hypothetical protein
VDTLRDQKAKADIIVFELAPRNVPVPLGWLLSNQARAEMMDQLGSPDFTEDPTNSAVSNPKPFAQVIRALRPIDGPPQLGAESSNPVLAKRQLSEEEKPHAQQLYH